MQANSTFDEILEKLKELLPGIGAGLGAFWAVFLIIFFCLFDVLLIIAFWKIYKKAGVPGFFSIIPVLNTFGYVKVCTGSYLKTLLLLIPIFNFFYCIALDFKLAKRFGKGVGFGFGLLFLPNVFTMILGFGRAKYNAK